MHLIMNALEEVTSRAHPNVSEISLLITLVSASAGFEPAEKSTKSRKLSQPTTVLITALPFPLFCMIQVLLLPRLKRWWTPLSFPLYSYCGNLNGE